MAEIERLSHSQIEQYLTCPAMYKYVRIDGAPRQEGLAAFAGSTFHSWADGYDRGELKPEDWGDHWAAAIAAQEQDQGAPIEETHRVSRKEDRGWWAERGLGYAKKYAAWRLATGWDVLGIEVEVRVQGADVPSLGYADRVFVTGSGTRVLVDTKTGARVYPTSQLYEYYAALNAQDWGINAVTYYDARAGRTTGLEYPSSWTIERLLSLINQVYTGIKLDLFPAHIGNHCDTICDARSTCEWKNPT